MAISAIEGLNKIEYRYVDDGNRSGKKRFIAQVVFAPEWNRAPEPLKVIKATKWSSSGGVWLSLTKIMVWPFNVILRLTMGVLDLLLFSWSVHLLNNVLNDKAVVYNRLHAVSAWISRAATAEINFDEEKKIIDLSRLAHRPLESIGRRVAHLFVTLIRNSVLDLASGLYATGKDVSLGLYQSVRDDIAAGLVPRKQQAVYRDLIVMLRTLRIERQEKTEMMVRMLNRKLAERHSEGEAPIPPLPSLQALDQQVQALTAKWAIPDYVPTAGEWNDILNAAVRGGDEFVSLFMHNIYTKHPFAGVLFSLAFAAGGFAILAPGFVSFLPSQYLWFSNQLGKAMANAMQNRQLQVVRRKQKFWRQFGS